MFMHASILHIGGNMLFLWIFGNNVEDSMGRVKFLVFYLLGGLAALALQVAVGPNSTAPTLGASGAIAAVLGGYILLYPRARVLTLVFIILFFTVIELPALVMLGIWFAEQAVFGAAGLTNPTGRGGGVAYFAHVGGFVVRAADDPAAGDPAQAGSATPARSRCTDRLRSFVLTHRAAVHRAARRADRRPTSSQRRLTGVGVLAVLILVAVPVGIVGALRHLLPRVTRLAGPQEGAPRRRRRARRRRGAATRRRAPR